MVIVCEKCDTRFQLDDSRVPAKGARVRCSRCKHAFFVKHPGRGEAGAAGQVVARDRGGDRGLRDAGEDWQFNEDSRPAIEPDREPGLEGIAAFDPAARDLAAEQGHDDIVVLLDQHQAEGAGADEGGN